MASVAPATSNTLPHSRRSARNLATVRKKSASAASAIPICAAAAAAWEPGLDQCAQIADAGGNDTGKLLSLAAAACVIRPPVRDQGDNAGPGAGNLVHQCHRRSQPSLRLNSHARDGRAQWVGVQFGAHGGRIVPSPSAQLQQRIGACDEILARGKPDGRQIQMHPRQHPLEVGRAAASS